MQLGLHGVDDAERVFAEAHDDDPPDGLAFAIELGDAATHVWSKLYVRHIPDANRRPSRVRAE